jgi:allophanate hydrolase
MRGVVPACRSLDCVSLFAASVADAHEAFARVRTFDPADPFAREWRSHWTEVRRIGVPRPDQLEFFGDDEARRLYLGAIERCRALGCELEEIDFEPFRSAAALLYAGPWVAERYAAVGGFLENHRDAGHPVTSRIILDARKYSAVDAFKASYELARLRKVVDRTWTKCDALLLPTTPTAYTVDQLLKEPIELNSRLGTYTNFSNLLDLCALAIPAGFRADRIPLGVTLMASAFHDDALAQFGATVLGEPASIAPARPGYVDLSVVGAHLSDQPLNHQLTSRGARLVKTCRTAADYRLFALANTQPSKPGLTRDPGFAGPGIETEVWRLGYEAFGQFVAEVPAPMGIGNVTLEDGTSVKGFLCEIAALSGARDISSFGGWRPFLRS